VKNLLITITATLACVGAYGQGTFQNLDFESANIPSGTPPLASFSFGDALPGWSGFYGNTSGTNPATFVVYDGMSLSGPMMAIFDALNTIGVHPLQGNYSPYLFGGWDPSHPTSMTISQTGLIPDGTTSIFMDVYAWNGFTVTLGGQTIISAAGPWSGEVGADISSFAGQTAQLSITVPSLPVSNLRPNGLMIDDIRFEPSPEPSVVALSVLGALILGRCIKGRQP
jgi:hypothetical protein